jgi:hypothetical protein
MDQQGASPATEGATESPIESAPQVDETSDTPAEGAVPEGAPQLGDEDYELNFLGTDKFKLDRQTPEEIRDALKKLEKSLNKGWTEKNMRLAEERRQVAAMQQETQQSAEIQKTTLKELAALESLQGQISEYDQVDWAKWAQTDPEAANRAFMTFQGIQRQHAKLDVDVKQKQDQERSRQQQNASAWLHKSDETLRQSIKDWSAEKGQALSKFVAETYLTTNTPMDQGALQAVSWHPGLVQMANEAMLYRDSLKRAAATPKPTPAVPVAKVAGGAALAAKDPNKMTDSEWFRYREQQIAAQNSANNRPRR